MSDFNRAFEVILEYEGGYSDDKDDRGGKTRFGITEDAARRNGYAGDMKELPLETARDIYKREYWDAINLDKILDYKTALEVFDVAVNMGVGTAARMLQRALNLLNRNEKSWNDLKVDGIIGEETLRVINNLPDQDYPPLYKLINGLQLIKYIDITTYNPTQERFLRGWLKRI